MTALALGTFVVALAMPAMGYLGGEFFPVSDNSEFVVPIETPPGSNLEYTSKKIEQIAALARSLPGVAYTYTTIGGATGAVDEGQVYVALMPKAERSENQDEIARRLRRRFVEIGGVTASIQTSGFDNQKQIQVQVQGPDIAILNRLADEVRTAVRQVPGAVDVGLSTRGQKPELDVRIDRALAGSLGVRVADVAQALRPAFAGVDAGDWVDPSGKTRDVTVRLAPESREHAARSRGTAARRQRCAGTSEDTAARPGGHDQPVARTGAHRPPRPRSRDLRAGQHGRPRAVEVVDDIQTKLDAMTLPPGYSSRRAARRRISRRCSRASSRRSASPCC